MPNKNQDNNLAAKLSYLGSIYVIVVFFIVSSLYDAYLLHSRVNLKATFILSGVVILLNFTVQRWLFRYPEKTVLRFTLAWLLFLNIFLFFVDWSRVLLSIGFIDSLAKASPFKPNVFIFLLLLVSQLIVWVCIYLVRSGLRGASALLTVFYSFLVIYKLISFVVFDTAKSSPANGTTGIKKERKTNTVKASGLPDIYYIVMDGYTSMTSLDKYWQFDNRELVSFLEKNGFYTADQSRCNYNVTIPSLASSLNYSYMGVKDGEWLNQNESGRLQAAIRNNEVCKTLQEKGYRVETYTFLDIGDFEGHRIKEDMDTNRRTLWDFFSSLWNRKQRLRILCNDIYDYNMKCFAYLDSCVQQADRVHQPVFYYIHTLATHVPYVFDSAGTFSIERSYSKEKYLESMQYANKRIITALGTLMQSSRKPVIILQGDHGSHLNDLSESSTILNSYYFPDRDYLGLHKEISPVNSFRVVLNKYFNAGLPMLENKWYNVSYY